MKEIGGYYSVEYSNIELGNIHRGAKRLNSGRYCIEYIVKARKYTRVYLPYFICNVVYEPLVRNHVEIVFYNIDKNMEPVSLPELKENEAFFYVNYFGFKNKFIGELAKKINNLIIDNCQSLFAPPQAGTDTFYGLRKFAGVSDGAFLYCGAELGEQLPPFDNSDRVSHLYLRANVGPNAGYQAFAGSESNMGELRMSQMSKSTENFIETYDFSKNKLTRERNFLVLHSILSGYNEYQAIDIQNICCPLYYPMLVNDPTMRAKMIANKIYTNTIWPDLDKRLEPDSFEYYLSANLLPLAIDHRYNTDDMKHIAGVFMKEFKK